MKSSPEQPLKGGHKRHEDSKGASWGEHDHPRDKLHEGQGKAYRARVGESTGRLGGRVGGPRGAERNPGVRRSCLHDSRAPQMVQGHTKY